MVDGDFACRARLLESNFLKAVGRDRGFWVRSDSSGGAAGGGGFGHFDELAGVDVVDVAVDGDGLRNERTGADTGHVCDDGLGLVFDREPFDELCGGAAWAFAEVLESFGGEG